MGLDLLVVQNLWINYSYLGKKMFPNTKEEWVLSIERALVAGSAFYLGYEAAKIHSGLAPDEAAIAPLAFAAVSMVVILALRKWARMVF